MADQLFNLVQTLTESEKTRFLDFLQSPYFNRRKELSVLGAAVLAGGRDKENLYQTAYPEQAYLDSRWRLLKSDLLQLVEQFLIINHTDELKASRQQLALQTILRHRQQAQRYEASKRRINKLAKALPQGSKSAHLQYELGWERVEAKMNARSMRVVDFNQLSEQLDRSYLLEALRLACHGLSTKTVEPGELHHGALNRYLDHPGFEEELQQDPLLSLYYYCYRMLGEPENVQAFKRFQLALPQVDNLAQGEARDLILLAINYCIRQVNSGDRAAGETALDLYQLGLEQGFLLEAGRLSRFTFNNMVAFALQAGANARAKDFIDQYSDRLSTTYRQSSTALNRARLAYEEGELNVAMDQLQAAKDQDVLTTLNIRVLQLRVYQKLAAYRLFDAQLESLDIYLRRRKDSLGYHYKAYRKLVSYLRQYRRLNQHDRAAIVSFREQTVREEGLPEKSWILKLIEMRG